MRSVTQQPEEQPCSHLSLAATHIRNMLEVLCVILEQSCYSSSELDHLLYIITTCIQEHQFRHNTSLILHTRKCIHTILTRYTVQQWDTKVMDLCETLLNR